MKYKYVTIDINDLKADEFDNMFVEIPSNSIAITIHECDFISWLEPIEPKEDFEWGETIQ